jgi:hypothetical protein
MQAVFGRHDYAHFRQEHGRLEEDAETHFRRAHTFLHHSSIIKRHNLQSDRTYTLALNRFADWSDDEFSGLLGLRRTAETQATIASVQAGKELTSYINGHRSKFQCASIAA